ncbi:MAG: LacI family DNA-binding transcriptional regulator [Acidimicrobiia bacterium]|nr:LacI family DNA-binding transcriptional regulator [Acidimicrobiia bacterium]
MKDAPERPVTMAQVADLAGVSVPTVSRVINSSAPVAEETRRAVVRAIETLGYHPNLMARGLSRGRSDTVLVILPHITEPSVAMRLSALIDVLRKSPYELHLVDLERPPEQRIRRIGEIVLRNRPAGVVIISLPLDDVDHRHIHNADVPVVLIDSTSTDFPSDSVDDIAGGELATNHLIGLGHTEIAFIGDQEETAIGVPASANRRLGYQRAMKFADLPVPSGYKGTAPHGMDTARRVARDMLRLSQPPTAIFAASDVQALGVLAAAREVGLDVPRQLSVIGFDDIQAASLTGLTTIRQPLEASGRRAGLQLLQMLGHRVREKKPEFPELEVVVRSTTGPVSSNTAQEPLSAVSLEKADMVTKVSSSPGSAARQARLIPRRK